MKKISIYLFLITIPIFLSAQERKIDSLLTLLNKDRDDTNKVNQLNALCQAYNSNGNTDKALQSGSEAATLSLKLDYIRGTGEAYNNIGVIYFGLHNYQNTLAYFQKALKVNERRGENTKTRVAIVLDNIGLVYEAEGDYARAQEYYFKAMKIAQEIGNKQLQAYTMGNLGNFYTMQGNDSKALEYYLKSVKIKEELGDKGGVARGSSNIGLHYKGQGDYPKALVYYLKALKIAEELGDKQLQANTTSNIGTVYREQGDYSKALEYDFKTLKLADDLNYKQMEVSAASDIGLIYWGRSNYSKAVEYYNNALKMAEESGDKATAAIITDNLGIICENQGDFPQALEYEFKALKISKEIGDKNGSAINTGNIGEIYIKQKNYKEAEKYILQALYLADTIHLLETIKESSLNLSELFSQTGEWKKAFEAYRQYAIAKDSLALNDKSREIGRVEAKEDYDKQLLLQKAEEDKNAAIAVIESKGRKVIMGFVGAIALTAAFIAMVILRSLRITRKQKAFIEMQKTEVENQKKLVEEKNKDILDSITYAKRLQDAILPPISIINQHLPECFVLFKPKDIVAGDFYFFNHLSATEGKSETILIAAADCTGNGVPGAMVSVVCSEALNRASKEFGITEPAKILNKAGELIQEAFEAKHGEIHDGMDISLLSINPAKNQGSLDISWAGSNIPLWIITNGSVLEISPDKYPLGDSRGKLFTGHSLKVQKGDTIYLFTDGFPNQLGNDVKGYVLFREKLLEITSLSMDEQKVKLEKMLEAHTGNSSLLDDVLIIGMRV